MNAARRNLGLALATLAVLALVLVSVGRGDSIDSLRRATARYEQDLVRWELAHAPDKWIRLATGIVRDDPGGEELAALVDEYFAIGEELRQANGDLESALAGAPGAESAPRVKARIETLEARRSRLAPVVEEAIEATLSQVADELGVIDRLGPVRWPPVDFTFEPGALLLVRSPRDEIVRIDDLLLRHDLDLLQQMEIEGKVESLDENISALVVRIGGVATYPSQVTPRASLHGVFFLAAHEWLHHWLIFRPLGRAWFAGGELASVNETVANIFAEEIGDIAFERFTGIAVDRATWSPPQPATQATPEPGVFDYRREMRATRLRLEDMLDIGDVAAAERYLEERRLLFVGNGHNIRKLNTAWFAFHGTYADSPASISPIEGWLRALRADSATLAEFLDRVAVIDAEGELEEIAGSLSHPQ